MRILLVTDWNRGRGGAEAYATWLRQGLREAGDDACLLTSSAGTAADGTADFVAFGTHQVAAQAFLQIANPFAAASVRHALRRFRPEVACVNMFAHHLSPAVLHALRAIPTVLLVSDYKCVCPIGSKLLPDGSLCNTQAGWVCCRAGCVSLPHWLRDRIRYPYIAAGVRGVRRVIACSRWVQQELAAAGIRSDVCLWPVPPPSPDFRRGPSAAPVFLFTGRLDVEKGTALLLRAFSRLRQKVPSAILRIAGDGPERANLERLAGTLGIADATTFLGWLSPRDIEQQLRDPWALVVPSLWAEPLGLVAIEAILRAVPVIASASGGLAEIVEQDVSGLLFPNNDETALAGCLQAVAEAAAFPAHTLPDQVVQRAARTFSMDRHIGDLRAIFQDVAAAQETRPA
jgi:glycosyltransferase involved in cell wall biosynthesis